MGYQLTSYQKQAVSAFHTYINDLGGQRPVIVLPTGTGKTVVFGTITNQFAELKSRKPKRVLILVHTIRLAIQTVESLCDQYPFLIDRMYGTRPGIALLQGENKNFDAVVTVASMQTLGAEDKEQSGLHPALKEYLKFGPPDFIIMDEMHHGAADTYADVIIPRLFEANPNAVLLGVTATLYRADGRSLKTIFDDVIYQMNILDAIEGGWLKAINAKRVWSKTERDTYLALMDASNWQEVIFENWRDHTKAKRPTIGFMKDLDRTQEMARYFNQRGIPAASMDYTRTIGPDQELPAGTKACREYTEHVVKEFKLGRIKAIFGKDMLLEGWDAPLTSCILLDREMKEGPLTQAVGRGLRRPPGTRRIWRENDHYVLEPYEGKPLHYPKDKCPYDLDCVVLDYTRSNTALLVTGTLGGSRQVKLPTESPQQEVEIIDITPVPDQYTKVLEEVDYWKVYDRDFFRMADDAWMVMQDGTMTTNCGGGFALFLLPPNTVLVTKLRRVIQMLNRIEGTGTADDADLRKKKRSYMAGIKMFKAFNLFAVQAPPPKEKPDGTEGFVRWNSSATVAEFVGRFPDHHQAWAVALPISQEHSTGSKFTVRKASWRSKAPSEPAINFLTSTSGMAGEMIADANRELGKLREAHGIRVFIKDVDPPKLAEDMLGISQLAGLTAGRVSSIISHCIIQSIVMRQFLNKQVKAVYAAESYWSPRYEEVRGDSQ